MDIRLIHYQYTLHHHVMDTVFSHNRIFVMFTFSHYKPQIYFGHPWCGNGGVFVLD